MAPSSVHFMIQIRAWFTGLIGLQILILTHTEDSVNTRVYPLCASFQEPWVCTESIWVQNLTNTDMMFTINLNPYYLWMKTYVSIYLSDIQIYRMETWLAIKGDTDLIDRIGCFKLSVRVEGYGRESMEIGGGRQSVMIRYKIWKSAKQKSVIKTWNCFH